MLSAYATLSVSATPMRGSVPAPRLSCPLEAECSRMLLLIVLGATSFSPLLRFVLPLGSILLTRSEYAPLHHCCSSLRLLPRLILGVSSLWRDRRADGSAICTDRCCIGIYAWWRLNATMGRGLGQHRAKLNWRRHSARTYRQGEWAPARSRNTARHHFSILARPVYRCFSSLLTC